MPLARLGRAAAAPRAGQLRFSRLAAGAVVVIGALALFGWGFAIPPLAAAVPGVAAAAILLAAWQAWILRRDSTTRSQFEDRSTNEVLGGLLESAPDAMIITDAAGAIVVVNSRTEALFGFPRRELTGQAVEVLIPERLRAVHQSHRAQFVAAPQARPMAGRELFGARKDGSEFPVEVSLSPLRTGEALFVIASVRDITVRKHAEQRLLGSLQEKDVLLREVHHRVKNNLAVISSMFYLQSTYTEDDGLRGILQDCRDRVRSMALVHETLYRSNDLAAVDLAEVAGVLSNELFRAYAERLSQIRLTTALEPISVGIDRAVPCGLILNELITNALKHAFPAGRGGRIHVALRQLAPPGFVLSVSDDGVGTPPEPPAGPAPRTLGMRLIALLARQLEGSFEIIRREPGMEARLTVAGPS